MNLEFSARLPLQCVYPACPSRKGGPESRHIVRRGFFRRSSDSRTLARFRCRRCERSFSQATLSEGFRQKKRQLNERIFRLLASSVTQRRIARLLKISRETVAQKALFLARRAELNQVAWLESIACLPFEQRVASLQFDEMESFERSKCLPLSIPLVVLPKRRKILALDVCSMPARGPWAKRSREKYGPRADDRAETAIALLKSLRPIFAPELQILSDQNPKYPGWIRKAFSPPDPNADSRLGIVLTPRQQQQRQPAPLRIKHKTVKGRRGCVVGQGELKRGGFDPLFSLNHTAAMIRANVSRMVRRTWCTTKRRDRLKAHLLIYADYHNRVLTRPGAVA